MDAQEIQERGIQGGEEQRGVRGGSAGEIPDPPARLYLKVLFVLVHWAGVLKLPCYSFQFSVFTFCSEVVHPRDGSTKSRVPIYWLH